MSPQEHSMLLLSIENQAAVMAALEQQAQGEAKEMLQKQIRETTTFFRRYYRYSPEVGGR